MSAKAEKTQVLGEILKMFGVEEADVAELPERIRNFVAGVMTPPCIVAFTFNPTTGQLNQIATSVLPKEARTYQALSQITLQVAQQFSNIAMEVATDVGKQERVEGHVQKPGDGEPRDGDCPERREVD